MASQVLFLILQSPNAVWNLSYPSSSHPHPTHIYKDVLHLDNWCCWYLVPLSQNNAPIPWLLCGRPTSLSQGDINSMVPFMYQSSLRDQTGDLKTTCFLDSFLLCPASFTPFLQEYFLLSSATESMIQVLLAPKAELRYSTFFLLAAAALSGFLSCQSEL